MSLLVQPFEKGAYTQVGLIKTMPYHGEINIERRQLRTNDGDCCIGIDLALPYDNFEEL